MTGAEGATSAAAAKRQPSDQSLLPHLRARKLVAQVSSADIAARLDSDSDAVTFYIGIDPTAPSLHCGHLVPLYLLVALAQRGHQPIVVIGDGTARIGDPSGKNDMRTLIARDVIARNADAITAQLTRILTRAGVQARFVRNGDWLNELNYIDFLRDIGGHFSVNHMLGFESFKRRLAAQQGLSFLEFNYMPLQAYDFLMLHRRYDCTLQIGGDDQWGNMVAGIDLIRRTERQQTYALTTPLILTASGEKMGKTAAGALFIDTARTSVFDYYQYWRNVDDRDVVDCLLRFTDCEAAKVAALLTAASPAGALTDMTPASTTDRRSLATPTTTQINAAKAYLAYEATRFAHGDEAAETAAAAAQALFGGSASTPVADSTTAHAVSAGSAPAGRTAIPGGNITTAALAAGISVIDLFAATPLCSSKSAARRLIEQGGAQINGTKITDSATVITVQWAPQRRLSLQAGKKRHWMLTVGD